LTQLVALVLVTAGCSATSTGSGQSSPATYSITVHEQQQTSGLGPPTDKQATFTAMVQATREGKAKNLVFSSVTGSGDATMLASTQALEGQVFTLRDTPKRVTVGGRHDETGGPFDTGVGILSPAETALAFEALVPTTARARTVQLFPSAAGAGSRVPVPVHEVVAGDRTERGIAVQQVTTVAGTERALAPTAAYVKDPAGDTYTANVLFGQLFGGPQKVAAPPPTESAPTTGPEYSEGGLAALGGLGGAISNFFGALGCLFSLGSACSDAMVTVPPAQVTTPVLLPDPATVVASMNTSLSLMSSQVVARHGGTLLTAAGSGQMDLTGLLSSGYGIPAALDGRYLGIVSDVTYSSQLVSPWPHPGPRRPDLAVKLAGILALLVVGAAAAALAASSRSA